MMSVKFGLGEDADIIDEKDGKIDSDNDDRSEDSDSSSNEGMFVSASFVVC